MCPDTTLTVYFISYLDMDEDVHDRVPSEACLSEDHLSHAFKVQACLYVG